MRSETEIRKQVETRLRRRGLLVLDGGLWLFISVGIIEYTRHRSFGIGEPWATIFVFFMLAWLGLVGLHTLRVIYVELREWLVRRAVERERQFYVLQDAYEKRKRDESFPRIVDESLPRSVIADDGELVDFPDDSRQKIKRD